MARTCVWARACQLYACRLRFEASVRKGEFDSISFDHLLVAIFIFVSNLLVRDLAATWNEERVRWHWQLRIEIITTYRNCSHRRVERRAAVDSRRYSFFLLAAATVHIVRDTWFTFRVIERRLYTRVSIFVEMFTEKETFFSLCFFFSHFRKNWWRAPRLTERSVFAR